MLTLRASPALQSALEKRAKEEGLPLATFCLRELSALVGVPYVRYVPYFATHGAEAVAARWGKRKRKHKKGTKPE